MTVKDKAFLIGNGINRAISNDVKSWWALLDKLSQKVEGDVDLHNEFKPFPLLFEEILHKSEGDFDARLKQIKEEIAELLLDAPPNRLHERLVKSGVQNILTTNYEYSFEKVLNKSFRNRIGETQRESTRETLNSIKRRSIFTQDQVPKKLDVEQLNVWHIHGEVNQRMSPSVASKTSRANSIMLGYEHYGVYLTEIQNYIKGPNGRKVIEKGLDSDSENESWIDFFFSGELHIAGISLDFAENHLWWLLNYRAKELSKSKSKFRNESDIFFYYNETVDVFPDDPSKYVLEYQKRKLNKAKLDMLTALRVKPVKIEIALNDFESYFDQVFNKTF